MPPPAFSVSPASVTASSSSSVSSSSSSVSFASPHRRRRRSALHSLLGSSNSLSTKKRSSASAKALLRPVLGLARQAAAAQSSPAPKNNIPRAAEAAVLRVFRSARPSLPQRAASVLCLRTPQIRAPSSGRHPEVESPGVVVPPPGTPLWRLIKPASSDVSPELAGSAFSIECALDDRVAGSIKEPDGQPPVDNEDTTAARIVALSPSSFPRLVVLPCCIAHQPLLPPLPCPPSPTTSNSHAIDKAERERAFQATLRQLGLDSLGLGKRRVLADPGADEPLETYFVRLKLSGCPQGGDIGAEAGSCIQSDSGESARFELETDSPPPSPSWVPSRYEGRSYPLMIGGNPPASKDEMAERETLCESVVLEWNPPAPWSSFNTDDHAAAADESDGLSVDFDVEDEDDESGAVPSPTMEDLHFEGAQVSNGASQRWYGPSSVSPASSSSNHSSSSSFMGFPDEVEQSRPQLAAAFSMLSFDGSSAHIFLSSGSEEGDSFLLEENLIIAATPTRDRPPRRDDDRFRRSPAPSPSPARVSSSSLNSGHDTLSPAPFSPFWPRGTGKHPRSPSVFPVSPPFHRLPPPSTRSPSSFTTTSPSPASASTLPRHHQLHRRPPLSASAAFALPRRLPLTPIFGSPAVAHSPASSTTFSTTNTRSPLRELPLSNLDRSSLLKQGPADGTPAPPPPPPPRRSASLSKLPNHTGFREGGPMRLFSAPPPSQHATMGEEVKGQSSGAGDRSAHASRRG